MPGSYVRAEVDTKDLHGDLFAVGDGLHLVLTRELRDGAKMIAHDARPLMRRGETSWKGSSGAKLPHIQDTYQVTARGVQAQIVSDHPAAPVWEFGGKIHPHQSITIPRTAPVHRAALADIDRITADLASAVDELMRGLGL